MASPWRFRRLRTRLGLLYTGLFAVVLAGLALTIYAVVERNAERQVNGELVASGTVFDRLWQQRTRQLGGAADLLARDFGFRAAVATHDGATIGSALANLRQRLHVPIAFVVGQDGAVTGSADARARADAAALWSALDAGRMSGVVELGGAARHVIAAPVMTPTLAGWVVSATTLPAREMRSREQLASIPIPATVRQRRADGRWVDGGRGAVAPALSHFVDRELAGAGPSDVTVTGETAIALAKPLPTMDGAPRTALLLRYPLVRALANLRQLQLAIAIAGLLGLLATVVGTWRIARSITRPITALDSAAGQLAGGTATAVAVESNDELGRLAASFNQMAADIAERERQITHLAFNDVLTGLPNRALFQEQLDRELRLRERQGGTVALLCLDLDDFKLVNDTLGHPIGDELLRRLAARLTEELGDVFVARLGGDEFVVIARDEAERVAQRALAVIGKPLIIDGHQVQPGASIGIAIAPGDGQDVGTLLKNADLALYRAKDLGRRTYSFFEAALDERAQARRQMEADLRIAIREGQFQLHFQPLFDLERNRIGSFEALIRWRHPTRGVVSPVDFISLAEETGLIVDIGAWVLREACAQAIAWPEHVKVAVNVSSVQFRRPGLSEVVLQALSASGLAPARLELEITESIFLEGSEATLTLLHSLRALGVRIALDDFGTGYSSLSYLQSFPFDKLKIDRSFIVNLLTKPGAGAIVRAIADIGHALGMEITAEGVEEQEQLAELRHHGCSSIQGYLFSRPIESTGIAGLLASDPGSARAASRGRAGRNVASYTGSS